MKASADVIVQHLTALLERYSRADPSNSDWPEREQWSLRELASLITSAQAAIERVAPPGSAYARRAADVLAEDTRNDIQLEHLIGIVDALRHDYEGGALVPLQELIRAEVFDDFLEMAEHLLQKGYKDPAAVLIGGVLEGELRKLAERAKIDVALPDGRPVKADALNAALAGQNVYGKLDQKSVTSWLDLRNKAAHAQYEEYSADQVVVMAMGVRNFVSRLSGAV